MCERTHHSLEQAKFQSRPKIRLRHQSQAPPKWRPGSLHSAVTGTSEMAFFNINILASVLFLCVLGVLSDVASCSSVSVQPSDVSPTSFGTFDLKELDEIVYNVEILSVPIPESTLREGLPSISANSNEGKSAPDEEAEPDGGGGGQDGIQNGVDGKYSSQEDEGEEELDTKTSDSEVCNCSDSRAHKTIIVHISIVLRP